MSDETPAGLCDAKLATSKARNRAMASGAAIPRSFRLEQSQHPLRAVRRPHRHDPPVSFAQCLRRTHTQILAPRSVVGPSMPREEGVRVGAG